MAAIATPSPRNNRFDALKAEVGQGLSIIRQSAPKPRRDHITGFRGLITAPRPDNDRPDAVKVKVRQGLSLVRRSARSSPPAYDIPPHRSVPTQVG